MYKEDLTQVTISWSKDKIISAIKSIDDIKKRREYAERHNYVV